MKIGLIQKTVALLQISINRGDFRPPACVADVIVERGGVGGGGGEGKRKLREKKGYWGEERGNPSPKSLFSLSPLPAPDYVCFSDYCPVARFLCPIGSNRAG